MTPERIHWTDRLIGLSSHLFFGFYIGFMVTGFLPDPWTFLPWVLGFLLIFSGSVFIHELAHLWAARSVGASVQELTLGEGPVLWRSVDRHATVWKLKALPFCGYVVTHPISDRIKEKTLWFIAAGPLADISLFILCLVLLNIWPHASSMSVEVNFALTMLATTKAMSFFDFFHSEKVSMDGKSFATDMQLIYRLLRWGHLYEMIMEQEVAFGEASLKAIRESEDSASESGAAFWNALIRIYPPEKTAQYYESLIDMGRQELIDDAIGGLDAFCTWALFLGEPKWIQKAIPLSRELFEKHGALITIQGTRGSYLILDNQIDEGIHMLEGVIEESEAPIDHAISATFLALAEAKLGNFDQADQWLHRAKAYDGEQVPMPWVAREVQKVREASRRPPLS